MANREQVEMLLRDGVEVWNRWRNEHPDIQPDLRQADLSMAHLRRADLIEADLSEADLSEADLSLADLSGADLSLAHLSLTNLSGADLTGARFRRAYLNLAGLSLADLRGADLSEADLSLADLSGADLTGADLERANCVGTNLSRATLMGCNVYGVSAWDVNLEGAVQADLRINPSYFWRESGITVDNLKVAQFLYLLLHNDEMRAVLDTITSKVVLILGRFSEERKPILDAIREALRRHSNRYIPVLFDFGPQQDKPVLETVKTLANLARFVIADLTDPNMVRSELSYITANLPTVPVQPLIQEGAKLPTEYETWVLYRSFLPLYSYPDLTHLLANLTESVITPVEAHVQARKL